MSRGTGGQDAGLGADHENAGAGRRKPSRPEMPARRIKRLGRWPDRDEHGRFVIRCSCARWSFAGTAGEIAAAARAHDDSPFRRHVVSIWGRVVAS